MYVIPGLKKTVFFDDGSGTFTFDYPCALF